MARSLLTTTLAFALACASEDADDGADDAASTDDAATLDDASASADDDAGTSATADDDADDGPVDDGSSDDAQDGGSSDTSTDGGVDTSSDDSSGTGSTGLECEPPDMHEPNDDVSQSYNLGAIGDDDDEGGMLEAALEGEDDEDWYRYIGSDDAGSVVDPTRNLDASGAIRLCKYIACTDGPADLAECPEGSSSGSTDTGHPGCCIQGGAIADFTLAFDCPGVSDDATVYIRVDSGPADACTPYTMDFHY
jgi:hypothetical protein